MNPIESKLDCEEIRTMPPACRGDAAVAAHVSTCPECREHLAWDDWFMGRLRHEQHAESVDLVPRVIQGVAARQRAAGLAAAALGLATVSAAAVLLIAIFFWHKPRPLVVVPPPWPPSHASSLDEFGDIIEIAADRPVQALERMDRQREALVQALNEFDPEFQP